jgi:hypothetical protein
MPAHRAVVVEYTKNARDGEWANTRIRKFAQYIPENLLPNDPPTR